MALQSHRSGRLLRLLAVALAVGMIATVGLFALPAARANFGIPGLSVAGSKYWGGVTFVPGETMSITFRATSLDSIDLLIQNASGNPSYTHTGIIMPATGVTTLLWTIPLAWPDGNAYSVQATDTTSGQVRTVAFVIQQYRMSVWTDRSGYLPGDSVTISWSAVYAQNGTPAPPGVGVIEAMNGAGANVLPAAQLNTTKSQGSYAFNISATATTPDTFTVEGWFNNTAGIRTSAATWNFGVGSLGINLAVQVPARGYFEPGEAVPVTIQTTITGIGGAREPNVPVSVNVTNQATGLVVPAYSNGALASDGTGVLNYVFQLGSTPTSGTYQVTATATAHGTLSATASATPFDVRSPPSFGATVLLDKSGYVSGDSLHATAQVVSTVPQTFTYTWTVLDSAGNIVGYQAGGTTSYTYTIPTTYQGNLQVQVRVDNGTGGVVVAFATAHAAFGYLSLTLDRTQFNAGDTITASFSLQSSLITNPTYNWVVLDAGNSVVGSGNTTSTTASFTTPNPSSSRYTFVVTASQSGRTVQATQTAYRADGYFLAISLDKSSYNPGDTMRITYTITTRGVSTLPSSYHFYVFLYGVGFEYVDAGSPTGALTFQVPGNTPTGNLLLLVQESNTGAVVYNVVHVGAVNPLVADVGGVPLFDILITLLFVVLLLAVILLWRRTGMGRVPSGPVAAKPSTPPPPPPSGPSQQTAGPMSVACKHCGASIEITTSKRPIEVMCPSCGETQVVQ
jgi:hypothetical protein